MEQFFSSFCHLSLVFSCHLMRAIADSLLWDSVSQELDWLSLGWQSCLDDGKETPFWVILLLCFFLLLPAMSWFPAFFYPSFPFWLLFDFPPHSLLFVLFCTCLPLQEDIWCVGRWGGLLAVKISCIFPLLSSFTLPAPLLTAAKLPSVKAFLLALMVGTALKAVIF